jgi:hypothetical protein
VFHEVKRRTHGNQKQDEHQSQAATRLYKNRQQAAHPHKPGSERFDYCSLAYPLAVILEIENRSMVKDTG